MTSSNPAAGPSAWRATRVRVAPSWSLVGVACASRSLCVAYEAHVYNANGAAPIGGHVLSSTNPVGGPSAWIPASIHDVADAVTCASGGLCLLGTRNGDVLSSRHPTLGAGSWRVVHVQGTPGREDDVLSVACATSTYCLAAIGNDFYTQVYRTTDPARRSSWIAIDDYPQGTSQSPLPLLTGGSCAADGFCAFVGVLQTFDGRLHGSTVLTSPGLGRRWVSQPIGDASTAVSCASAHFCVAVGSRGSTGRLAVGTG